jgi:hypothetical protein
MGMFKEAWARYRLGKHRQRQLSDAFAGVGIDYMSLDTTFHERLLKEAMDTDAATVVTKYTPLLRAFNKVAEHAAIMKIAERSPIAALEALLDKRGTGDAQKK